MLENVTYSVCFSTKYAVESTRELFQMPTKEEEVLVEELELLPEPEEPPVLEEELVELFVVLVDGEELVLTLI